MTEDETSTGTEPSPDAPLTKRRRLIAARGLVAFIGGAAIAAFALYAFIIVYGTWASQ